MNCLEFRRHILEDPLHPEDAMLGHEESCAECAAYARQVRADEIRLRAVLREVEAPAEMAGRIHLATRLEPHKGSRRLWYGMAASLLLAITVTAFNFLQTGAEREHMALAQSVLHHIDDEAHHLREAGPADPNRIRYVFDRFNAELIGALGRVNFAAECLMRKRTGVHLVLSGEVGPVTVFFMPGETPPATMPVASSRFEGKVEPTSWGSIAVVGEKGEALDGMLQRMVAAVRWPSAGLVDGAVPGGPAVAQQEDG